MGDTFFLLPGAPPELPRTFQAAWAELHGVTVDRNRLRHVERVALGSHVLYVKFFHRPRWADLARNLFTAPRSRSQAEREVRMAGALFACGLKAVTPVAYGQRRLGPLERASVLVTREQPGPTLGESLRARSGAAKAWSGRLLGLLCALFRHGLFLPDLSLEHILVAEDQDLVVLDLHNAGRKPPTPARAARILGRLWAGARDTLPPLAALALGARALEPFFDRSRRRAVLGLAARLGARWEHRERRKRRVQGPP